MRNSFKFAVFTFLTSVLLSACGATPTVQAQPTSQVDNQIVAEGVVLPIQSVDLGFFPNGGVLEKVNKIAGDQVNAGDSISQLVLTPQLAASVAAAEEELLLSQNALQSFLDQAEVSKTQAAYDLALAKEKYNDAMDKKRDKEYTYRYSKTRESKVELDKALSNYDLTLAQVALGELELAKWADGPDPIQLAELKARVANAEAQLAAVKASASSQLVLAAPWSGTVITNNLVQGQIVQAGTTYVQLADQSSWKVVTTDLKETDIAKIKVGEKASVAVDAIPGKEYQAEVVSIEGIGVDKQGDITYEVTLSIQSDQALKWNMTANVTFIE